MSVAGDVLAFAALALNQVTGSSIYQGVAAVLIALVIIGVSLRLMSRSHDFLTGARTGAAGGPQGRDVAGITQPLTPAEEEKMRALMLGHPGVDHHRPALGHLRRSGPGPGSSPGSTSTMACAAPRSRHWHTASSRA